MAQKNSTQSYFSNDYVKHKGHYIVTSLENKTNLKIMAGRVQTVSDDDHFITFVKPFASTCIAVTITRECTGCQRPIGILANSLKKNGFMVNRDNDINNSSGWIRYIAVGY